MEATRLLVQEKTKAPKQDPEDESGSLIKLITLVVIY
jgi:hypothetical protein